MHRPGNRAFASVRMLRGLRIESQRAKRLKSLVAATAAPEATPTTVPVLASATLIIISNLRRNRERRKGGCQDIAATTRANDEASGLVWVQLISFFMQLSMLGCFSRGESTHNGGTKAAEFQTTRDSKGIVSK